MKDKLRAGIIGATGMVGQRFILLLQNHPYFEIAALAASSHSAGKLYRDAVEGKWKMTDSIPEKVAAMQVSDAADIDSMAEKVDFVFCAVNMKKEEIKLLEESYAKKEIPVISNNSANRYSDDVPMVIPEINPEHLGVIEYQKKRLHTKRGFIAVKPNCSIQSYVPMLSPLRKYGIEKVLVSTYQAISGSGKTFRECPEILDNVFPYIAGEEEKSEIEPLKIWGHIENGKIINAESPLISAQCLRVAVSDGHMATVDVSFKDKPTKEQIIDEWQKFAGLPQELHLPSAPEHFITYYSDDNRPQPALDRNLYGGMGVSVGRLREDNILDYKFVGFSHNTLRGAAGGGVLIAELLYRKGYLD
jgi:aspartate-semialdehyde dehydrogenase